MNIIQYFNDSETISLSCITKLDLATSCTRQKKSMKHTFRVQLDLKDLYTNFEIHDVTNFSTTDSWNNVTVERANYYLKRNYGIEWICTTESTH